MKLSMNFIVEGYPHCYFMICQREWFIFVSESESVNCEKHGKKVVWRFVFGNFVNKTKILQKLFKKILGHSVDLKNVTSEEEFTPFRTCLLSEGLVKIASSYYCRFFLMVEKVNELYSGFRRRPVKLLSVAQTPFGWATM